MMLRREIVYCNLIPQNLHTINTNIKNHHKKYYIGKLRLFQRGPCRKSPINIFNDVLRYYRLSYGGWRKYRQAGNDTLRYIYTIYTYILGISRVAGHILRI